MIIGMAMLLVAGALAGLQLSRYLTETSSRAPAERGSTTTEDGSVMEPELDSHDRAVGLGGPALTGDEIVPARTLADIVATHGLGL